MRPPNARCAQPPRRALASLALGTFDLIWTVIAIVGGIAGIALIVYLQAKGPREYQAEDAAREHFDRTGRWPDERGEG